MLSDWDSDLTELSSSSEDEYVPRKKKSTVNTNGNYRVLNMLRAPRTTTYSARSLYEQILDNTIELDPEYQRDVVWQEHKQISLIDSILRNYYIPPVIFALTVAEDGSEKRVCIDGKQRLTSLQLFMDGIICHKDSQTNKRYYYRQTPGPKRNILPAQLISQFANKQIVCVEYEGLTGDQEREIFQRVQNGVALTPAERMRAHNGPWSDLIREIQTNVLGAAGFDLEWDSSRGRDFQCLASILFLLESYPTTKFPGSVQLDKWLQSSTPIPAAFRREVLDTFKVFRTLVKDKKLNMTFQKPTRVSPVEFTMTGILIHLYRNELSLGQLSQAIWNMRADVRSKHEDVRSNPKVTKTMFDFIKKGIKKAALKAKSGDVSASVAISQMESPRVVKRKREAEASPRSESESADEAPLKKIATKSRKSTKRTKRMQPGSDSESYMEASDDEPPKKSTTKKNIAGTKTRAAAATPKTATEVIEQVAVWERKSSLRNKSSMQAPSAVPKDSLKSRPSVSSSLVFQCKTSPAGSTQRSLTATTAVASESPVGTPLSGQTQRPSPLSLSVPRKSSVATSSSALTSPVSPTPMTAPQSPMQNLAPDIKVKQEPDEVALFSATSKDRLAVIRAARARIRGVAQPPHLSTVTAARPTSPIVISSTESSPRVTNKFCADTSDQPRDGVLDGLPPITSERPRPTPIAATSVSAETRANPVNPISSAPTETTQSIPFTQENLNKILELNGLFSGPAPITSAGPSSVADATSQKQHSTHQQYVTSADASVSPERPVLTGQALPGSSHAPPVSPSLSTLRSLPPPPPPPFLPSGIAGASSTVTAGSSSYHSPLPDIPGFNPLPVQLLTPLDPPVKIKVEHSPTLLFGVQPAPSAPRRMTLPSHSMPSLSCGQGPLSAPAGASSFDYGRSSRDRSPAGRGRLRTADWTRERRSNSRSMSRSRSITSDRRSWSRDRDRHGRERSRDRWMRPSDREVRERDRGSGWRYRDAREWSPEPYARRGRECGRSTYRGRRP